MQNPCFNREVSFAAHSSDVDDSKRYFTASIDVLTESHSVPTENFCAVPELSNCRCELHKTRRSERAVDESGRVLNHIDVLLPRFSFIGCNTYMLGQYIYGYKCAS